METPKSSEKPEAARLPLPPCKSCCLLKAVVGKPYVIKLTLNHNNPMRLGDMVGGSRIGSLRPNRQNDSPFISWILNCHEDVKEVTEGVFSNQGQEQSH